ncbi:glycosyltransferase [Marinilabilia salmonicolor]|uniref:Glycosyl transferase family 2 n=1 Tax=Marinilabilia salmonicolor TaxID=989 RepID=A0A368V6K8_9BACT|nr:glycosyltransferase [Marinilabilia salmonicolor]RCW36722.1 glycosyl transferase family 2 [Marinilabilia salmonicolor]
MTSKSFVSIILPVFNGEKTLRNTVESLLTQSFVDFELLICIDGSSDGSEKILNEFEDKRLKIFKNEKNLGLARTLNRLMSEISSKCDYVAMAEQDDWYYPERLALQVGFLDKSPGVGMVSGLAEHWNGDDDKVTLFPGILKNNGQYPSDYVEFLKFNYRNQIKVVNTCMMFRKSVYTNYGLYFSSHYPNVSVDWSFVLRFSKYAVIAGIPRVLVRMDRREARQSITMNKSKQFAAAHELLRNFLYECEELDRWDFRYAKVTQYLLEFGSYNYLRCWVPLLKAFWFSPLDRRIYKGLGKRLTKRFSRV